MAKRYPATIDRTLDDGTLRAKAVHIGDGYYSLTCSCEVCGEEATQTWTVTKDKVKGIGSAWFQKHHHFP